MNRRIVDEKFIDTGFCYVISIISGKFKLSVLYALAEFGAVRFKALQRYIGKISVKTLSSVLKELEADGLVHREDFHELPFRVEYSLTERAKSLIPLLDGLCEWGERNRPI